MKRLLLVLLALSSFASLRSRLRRSTCFAVLAVSLCSAVTRNSSFGADAPLRIFIRSGPKSHGPGAHDFPQFLKDWVPMLNERGAKASGKDGFPTKEELDNTDVLILHAQEAGNIAVGEERKNLLEFLKRGGGLVVIHAGIVSRDPDWFKTITGGSWNHKTPTKWLEAPMSLYFTDHQNPITQGISNFDIDDEIYYDMDILPEVKVLAAAYTPKAIDTGGKGNKEAQQRAAEAVAKGKAVNIYDIQPQMWTYERTAEGGSTPYRAFVCIPGHYYANFSHAGLRTAILRGIAWAAKRENADTLSKSSELADLRYPPGGCPRPQEMPKHLEVHPEFDLTLVAAEPLINKPMNVDWDEKGRLWVVETPEYPNGRRIPNTDPWKDSGSLYPYQQDRDPQDKVSILSDTDGDGVMDKKHVFADKLELCTSFCFYKNGVIACAAPDIWFLQDTDGDEVADKRTKLYTNLGIRDTHAVINNLRWGLDGWVYATHGYSSTEDATSGDGTKHFGPIGAGVVRFKPDGSAIEQYASRGGNTWGLDITKDGQVFYTQPTSGNHFIHVVLPEYVLAKGKLPGVMGTNGMLPKEPTFPAMHWEQQAYVQIDQVGSYTAAAGCAIYEGGAWPAKWNYGYFTTEPTLNIVSHFMVEKNGVTYKAHREPGREQTEFIRSKNLWFRPIEVRVGPDGALYVVDFCNQAVIHNDTRGPLHGPANAAVRPDRDHYYGRIWKVQHKQAKAPSSPASRRDEITQGTQGSAALEAYQAAEQAVMDESGRQRVLKDFAAAQDDWTRSALIAACGAKALACIKTALANVSTDAINSLVAALIPPALQSGPAELIDACASAGSGANSLKTTILGGIAQQQGDSPAMTPALLEGLKKLLNQPSTAALALPLVAKWDTKGEMAGAVKAQVASLSARLADKSASTPGRITAARALIGVGGEARRDVVPTLADQDAPEALQSAIIQALSESGDVSELVPVYVRLKPALQYAAFDAILARSPATRALLDLIEEGKLKAVDLGPSNVARLRTHPNKQVATRANKMLEKLSPTIVEKNKLIAQLTPEVEKPGDPAKGKVAYALCATCHKLGDIGVAVGPPLDGMGAHGPAELLVHIIDPNREVDPSFWAHNVVTKKGEAIVGVVTAENPATLTLATQIGVKEIPKSEIATRENTHRSLMPEGLEAMGPAALRDLLAFICGDALKHFRIVDLRPAYTADSREGVFAGPGPNQGQVRLAKFGNMKIQNVPFFIQDPVKSSTGANLIVLKGGPSPDNFSQSFPAKVEVPINVETRRLQLLSGISGWGFPAVRDETPALKATVVYASGEQEEFTLVNGIHFSDYIRPVEVPGSKLVEGLTDGQQMRLLTLELTKRGVARTLILESPAGNKTVPVIAAITADIEGKGPAPGSTDVSKRPEPARGKGKGKAKTATDASIKPEDAPKTGGPGDGPLAPTAPVKWDPAKTKVLVIGGGSSHNFQKFFGETDTTTLEAAGFSVNYTEDRDQAASELKNADVAVISVNRKFFDTTAYRKALFDFAAAGKGIVMLHPGTWYGYAEWPELNAQIVGGGARGHDKLGPFTVSVLAKDHPVMNGVPASFDVFDELYYVNAEPDKIPAGTAPIEVLAQTSPSQKFGKPHPSVWITKHDKARVVGIALGHDERVHDLDGFKIILSNAVKWVASKK